MKEVFADTLYWVAIVKPDDPYAKGAKQAEEDLGEFITVTTDEVLAEFLTSLSKGGAVLRKIAANMVHAILDNPNVKVVPQSRDSFLKGLELYKNRTDKKYSLTDCVSMNVMKNKKISEALTHDHHFEQEGFKNLMKK